MLANSPEVFGIKVFEIQFPHGWRFRTVHICTNSKTDNLEPCRLKIGYKNQVQSSQWLEYRTKHDEIIWKLSQTGTLNSSHKNAAKLNVFFVGVGDSSPKFRGKHDCFLTSPWATKVSLLGISECYLYTHVYTHTSFPDLTLKWNKMLSVIPDDFHHMKLTLRTTNANSKPCHNLFGV